MKINLRSWIRIWNWIRIHQKVCVRVRILTAITAINRYSLSLLILKYLQEAEEESEVMVDMYMANGGSLEEFLDQYREKRKLAHMRRIKIDKMRELLAAKKVRQSDRCNRKLCRGSGFNQLSESGSVSREQKMINKIRKK
jgi:hypothetical protein